MGSELSLGEVGQDEAEGGEAHLVGNTERRLWAGGGGCWEVEDVVDGEMEGKGKNGEGQGPSGEGRRVPPSVGRR